VSGSGDVTLLVVPFMVSCGTDSAVVMDPVVKLLAVSFVASP
jgi:hypothetical protein